MKVIAVVLAGGSGSRFWPKSSGGTPKQFLDLFGEGSLLQSTVRRLTLLVPRESIYVSTTSAHERLVRRQLPDLPGGNIIAEPIGRDTAAAVGYALAMLGESAMDAVAVVVPSDHHIAGESEWVEALSDSCRMAERGGPVLVGVPPTRAETSYGYILTSGAPDIDLPGRTRFFSVAQFIEKPSRDLAERLIAGSNCLWNSGMFVWRVSTFLSLLRETLPETATTLEEIGRMKDGPGAPSPGSQEWQVRAAALLLRLKPVSLDYGIMEKCRHSAVALGRFQWDDVGNWDALARLSPVDRHGNVCLGEVILHDSGKCIIDWPGGQAVVIGADSLVVAGYDGKLLVCARDRLGEIKNVLSTDRFAVANDQTARGPVSGEAPPGPRVVLKPWGREIWWSVTDKYAAKMLEVRSGLSSSLHYHRVKHETLYFQGGQGHMELGDRGYEVGPGSVYEVQPGVPHRIRAVTTLHIVEVSTPDLGDVVRLDDDYGRAGEETVP